MRCDHSFFHVSSSELTKITCFKRFSGFHLAKSSCSVMIRSKVTLWYDAREPNVFNLWKTNLHYLECLEQGHKHREALWSVQCRWHSYKACQALNVPRYWLCQWDFKQEIPKGHTWKCQQLSLMDHSKSAFFLHLSCMTYQHLVTEK